MSTLRQEDVYLRLIVRTETEYINTATSVIGSYTQGKDDLNEPKIKKWFRSLVDEGKIQQEPMNYDAATLQIYIDHLEKENAALRERLGKAVELPVKVGDTVYFIPTYNGKPIWGVQRGIVQMVGITRQGYHVKIRDRADFNKTYMFRKSAFLSKEQAEARLAELKGGKDEQA